MCVYSQFGTCCHLPACFASFSPSTVCYCYMPAIMMIKLFLSRCPPYTISRDIFICPTNNQHGAIARSISRVNSTFTDTTPQSNDRSGGNIACEKKIKQDLRALRAFARLKQFELSKRHFRAKVRLDDIHPSIDLCVRDCRWRFDVSPSMRLMLRRRGS